MHEIKVYAPADITIRELAKLVTSIRAAGLVLQDLNVTKSDFPVVELVFHKPEKANGSETSSKRSN